MDCYQKREVSITSFSDTRAFVGPSLGLLTGPLCEIALQKKARGKSLMSYILVFFSLSREDRSWSRTRLIKARRTLGGVLRFPLHVSSAGSRVGEESLLLFARFLASVCKLLVQSRPILYSVAQNITWLFFPSIIHRAELWEAIRVWWAGAGIKPVGSLLCRRCFSSYRFLRADLCSCVPNGRQHDTPVAWQEVTSPSRPTLCSLLLGRSELRMGKCLFRNGTCPPFQGDTSSV